MVQAYVTHKVSDATIRALNYAPEVERLRGGPRSRVGWRSQRLDALTAELGKAYARVLLRVDCSSSHGDELLSQVDAFAAEPSGRRIRGDLMTFVEDLRIRRGDVLIAGAGQIGESTLFGRAIVADSRLTGKLAAGDLMVLRFANPDASLALYTYAFLLSTAGRRAICAAAYGTSIPRMRPDLLAALPVPLPDATTQSRVAEYIRASMEGREVYARELQAARSVVEALPEMVRARTFCARGGARVNVWSKDLFAICARPFASVGSALNEFLDSWRTRVGDLLEAGGCFYGNLRQRSPCTPGWGVQLASQRDALSVRPIGQAIARPRMDPKTVFSPAGTIVVSGVGGVGEGHSVGIPVFVTSRLAGFAFSQHFLRLFPRPGCAEFLYAYLSTEVGRALMRSAAAGTIVSQLRVDIVERLPVPDLGAKDISAITAHVRAASSALDAAGEAEDNAVRIIETEVLPAWHG